MAALRLRSRTQEASITRSELLRREVLAMLIACSALLVIALAIPAPIAAPISADGLISGDTGTPWFFLWIQALLKTGIRLFGILLPVLVIVILGLLPYILPLPRKEEQGRWFPRGGRLAQVIVLLLFAAILAYTLMGAILY